ncbi:MAG: hypothetical protein RL660_3150 [Bacteroidota bacterium]|jgi:hypothetical protein
MSTTRSIYSNHSSIRKFVIENLANDVPKQVIFDELSPLVKEQGVLARLVQSCPSRNEFKNAKLQRYFLALAVVLLCATSLFIIWSGYFDTSNASMSNQTLIGGMLSTAMISLALFIDLRGLLFFGKYVMPLGFLLSIIFSMLPPYLSYSGDLQYVRLGAILLVIAGLLLYSRKLKSGMFYREQKDATGNYVFND